MFNSSISNNHVPETNEEITFEETIHAIHNMKLNTSPDIDGIPSGVYRALIEQWISLLTNLFKDALRSGEYPSCWSIGLICPLYKSGPKADPNNCRGITLLKCIGNIFTSNLGNRLCEWTESNKLLSEAQFVFRRNRRTTDCIFILNTH